MSLSCFVSDPVTQLRGEISVPGDKSISHRSIILGAIANGKTSVSGFLDGDDCIATIRAFRAMGVVIEGPIDQNVVIHGVGKYGLQKPVDIIDCGNSGTSIRLLAGLLAAQSFDSSLTGDLSLQMRPMARVSKPLTLMGAGIRTTDGKPPIYIEGGKSLTGIRYEMPEASAQVKSCLLLAGLYSKGTTTIVEPGITRDHTERMLKAFSYPVTVHGNEISLNSDGECQGTEIKVPGDISSAAFFIVAATLVPGSELLIRNVGINPGRTGVIQILDKMGANIRLLNERIYGDEPVADLLVQSSPLTGIDIPASLVPLAIDEFPIIFIAAACAHGTTRLRNAKELRGKESDRIAAMTDGLQRLGITCKAHEDGIDIEGGSLQGGVVHSYHDHRIAMAFSIAGAVAKRPVTIKDCINVSTSFPSFVQTANAAGMQLGDYTD
ncbi:3-phosphoshikimate 1-carboxyvinyltransferase [Legionella sp. CNM-4043-24]|uniref:3-phosphoshikimate 1-carboxyvinyltransferase n=1 Tax=Legionella sp. CNM-4043-24 TaxID=3421646 RepID=UPI00403B2742